MSDMMLPLIMSYSYKVFWGLSSSLRRHHEPKASRDPRSRRRGADFPRKLSGLSRTGARRYDAIVSICGEWVKNDFNTIGSPTDNSREGLPVSLRQGRNVLDCVGLVRNALKIKTKS